MKITIDLSSIIGEKDQRQAYQALKDQIEPAFLTELLKQANNNKQEAARIAGFQVATMNKKLKRYGIYIARKVARHGGSNHV